MGYLILFILFIISDIASFVNFLQPILNEKYSEQTKNQKQEGVKYWNGFILWIAVSLSHSIFFEYSIIFR